MPDPYPDKNKFKTCSVLEKLNNLRRCYAFQQQFLHYYRYGSNRDCTDEWEEAQICMKSKSKPKEQSEEFLETFYQEREKRKNQLPNSLDVWSLREKPLENFPPDNGFPDTLNLPKV